MKSFYVRGYTAIIDLLLQMMNIIGYKLPSSPQLPQRNT
jgi:hypothetical protein